MFAMGDAFALTFSIIGSSAENHTPPETSNMGRP
jgi:hypothetical protein